MSSEKQYAAQHRKNRGPLLKFVCLPLIAAGFFCLLFAACESKDATQDKAAKEKIGKVVIAGDADIAVPCPVKLEGKDIATALSKDKDKSGRPVITISIPEKNTAHMKEVSAFWIGEDGGKACLYYEVLHEDSPPKKGDFVFMGFPSRTSFLVWKGKALAKKGVGDAKAAVNDAKAAVNKVVQDIKAGLK